MKLVRFGDAGMEKPGVYLHEVGILDASSVTNDYDEAFFESDGLARLRAKLESGRGDLPPAPDGARIAAPVARPSKIVAVGLNYSDHAEESGMEVPKEPVLFMKASTALSGPYDEIEIPRDARKVDWEVELAFVIGKRAKYASESEAESYIAGYTIMNDVSEREFQLERCGQWVKGKSHDGFAPLGPYLVTLDEVGDPSNLSMELSVNGEVRQSGSTSTMVFKPPFLVAYISRFMTLLPGDVITTGTPPGVGMGMKPPHYLKPGDLVELSIERLGTQRQWLVAND